jgi:hypothetical protein
MCGAEGIDLCLAHLHIGVSNMGGAFKKKIELKDAKKANDSGTNIKYLSVGKTKIPMTEEEHEFIRAKIDEHIEKHGITYGLIFNLFLKEDTDEKEPNDN